jgi:ubiquinone/menaquinone biosynthesis C-methylase UbiE
LGCGGGRHTEMLVNMGFDTYAVDINTEMIEITKRRTGIDNKINYGEILNIPHEDNFFDVVVTTGVLHQAKNLIEYKKAILELERICKNGAVVCLNIFTNDLFDESYIHKNQEDYNEVETKEGLLMYLISKEDFVEIMKQSGFVLENYQLDFVNENTGQRAVFRANFIKK